MNTRLMKTTAILLLIITSVFIFPSCSNGLILSDTGEKASQDVLGGTYSSAHILLLLHFDNSYDGINGERGNPNGVNFTIGKYSKAVQINSGNTLTYDSAGNLNRTQGTIEFWVRPHWNGRDNQGYTFFEIGNDWFNRMRIMKDGANNLRFMLWDSTTEYGVAYNIADWRAGEWHHVAATWIETTITLYVDGEQRDRRTAANPPQILGNTLYIGSSSGLDQQANADIDEFRISDIPDITQPSLVAPADKPSPTATTKPPLTTTTTIPEPTPETVPNPTPIDLQYAGFTTDLDVLYIERTPRYYRYFADYPNDIPTLHPGTENNKRWPDPGEKVTYTAYVMNKGNFTNSIFKYQWLVNNVVVDNGDLTALGPGQRTSISYTRVWPSSPENIQFKVDTENVIPELNENNNSLIITSHDLTISIWIEKGLYNIFENTINPAGSHSFEDWIQAHFTKMNERFSQAKYPVAIKGILDRVRIDKIIIADNLDGPSSPMQSDPNLYLIDGRWQFADGDSTNNAGQNGVWQKYVDEYINKIDWGLIHELSHQLGVIDDYRMNLANDPQNNMRVQVKNINGNVIPASKLPTYAWDQILFKYPGIMAGGSTFPYEDNTYFTSHNAAGINTNYGYRRGYYGDYLFDTPSENYLKVLDATGNPIGGAEVRLFQRNPSTEYIDNIPEISGTTGNDGIIRLPNRPVTSVTTATGHTLRDNPFGQINVVGTNSTMLVQVFKDGKEGYGWLFIIDLNLAYWSGNRDSATYTVQTTLPH